MNKIYDKLLLATAVLLLAGGVFLYLQKSGTVTSLNPQIDVQPADKPYFPKTASSLSPAEVIGQKRLNNRLVGVMMYLHRPRFSLMKMVSSLKKGGSHLCRHLPSASI